MNLSWLSALKDLPVITSMAAPIDDEILQIDESTTKIRATHVYVSGLEKFVYHMVIAGESHDEIDRLIDEISMELGPVCDRRRQAMFRFAVCWPSNYSGWPRSIYERFFPGELFDKICSELNLSISDEKDLCRFLAECEILTKRINRILSFDYLCIFLETDYPAKLRIYEAAIIICRNLQYSQK